MASGWGGQKIIVLPELEMVVVLTGGDYDQVSPIAEWKIILNNYIIPGTLLFN